jgi:hypothetical protein
MVGKLVGKWILRASPIAMPLKDLRIGAIAHDLM